MCEDLEGSDEKWKKLKSVAIDIEKEYLKLMAELLKKECSQKGNSC